MAEYRICFNQIPNHSNYIDFQELFHSLAFCTFSGCVLVNGRTMVRELEVSMHATVMKQQNKREWYVIHGFMLLASSLHEHLLCSSALNLIAFL